MKFNTCEANSSPINKPSFIFIAPTIIMEKLIIILKRIKKKIVKKIIYDTKRK